MVFYGKLDSGPIPLKDGGAKSLSINKELSAEQKVLVVRHNADLAYYYVFTPLPEDNQKKVEEGIRDLFSQ